MLFFERKTSRNSSAGGPGTEAADALQQLWLPEPAISGRPSLCRRSEGAGPKPWLLASAITILPSIYIYIEDRVKDLGNIYIYIM